MSKLKSKELKLYMWLVIDAKKKKVVCQYVRGIYYLSDLLCLPNHAPLSCATVNSCMYL